MPYIHFSEQEKQMANEADIVSYLHSIGEPTERQRREIEDKKNAIMRLL